MNVVRGDLLELARAGHFDVIMHGCNCFCTMGAGIARQIKAQFPEAYEADCATTSGDRDKLGSVTWAQIMTDQGTPCIVVNAYTQFDYRGKVPRVDYEAVRSCALVIRARFPNARLGYPKIGAGLAGGDWGRIERILNEVFEGMEHTLVLY